jgi:hypothetical protein
MMLSEIRDRLRARGKGIKSGRFFAYFFVWFLRTVTRGIVQIHYKYIIVQPVPEKPLLGGRTGSLVVKTLRGEKLVQEFERDHDGAFSRPPKSLERTRHRVDQGDICFVASRDSRILGTLWLCFGTFDETEVRCDFVVSPEIRLAWDYNLYIVEDARGGLLFAALWDAANEELRKLGYQGTATMTSAFNGPSLQAHSRLGARRIGGVLFFSVGPLQLAFSSLRPRVHFSGPTSRPVYEIPRPDDIGEGRSLEV